MYGESGSADSGLESGQHESQLGLLSMERGSRSQACNAGAVDTDCAAGTPM